MNRLIEAIVCAGLSSLLTVQPVAAQTASAVGKQVKLPRGTRIELQLLEALSSEAAHKGQKVRMEVASDVMVGGDYVLHEGTQAEGVVKQAKRAIPGKQDAVLQIAPTRILLPDGISLKVLGVDPNDDCAHVPVTCALMITLMGIPTVVVGAVASPVLVVKAIKEHAHNKESAPKPSEILIPAVPLEARQIELPRYLSVTSYTLHSERLRVIAAPPHLAAETP